MGTGGCGGCAELRAEVEALRKQVSDLHGDLRRACRSIDLQREQYVRSHNRAERLRERVTRLEARVEELQASRRGPDPEIDARSAQVIRWREEGVTWADVCHRLGESRRTLERGVQRYKKRLREGGGDR